MIIGGGGHGLATAYYLATRHGITNVAVIEANYIGSGNSGRNTTIIRANYGIPESIRFYQHSLELYRTLEDETGCWIMHSTKGLLWLAHTETAMRGGAGPLHAQHRVRRRDGAGHAGGGQGDLCPQLDLSGGGRYPVLGASHHVGAATARHDRVVWAYAQGAMRRGVHVLQHTPVTGLLRDGDRVIGVRDRDRRHRRRRRAQRRRRQRHDDRRLRRRAPAGPHPPAAGVRHQRVRAGPRPDRQRHRTALLRVADGTRPDADRRRVRSAAELLAAVVVQLPAELRGEGQPTCCRSCANLRILRQWTGICDISADFSPIMGDTGVDGFLITTGWGTWGFKAIPAGGEQMAELIATGRTPPI